MRPHLAAFLVLAGLSAGARAFGGNDLVLPRPFQQYSEPKWDLVHRKLLFLANSGGTGAVRLFHDGGARPGPAITPGGAIWDAAPTANGGLVLAMTVPPSASGSPNRLLTYDAAGQLVGNWDVYPYHHHGVATDAQGNVYALGHPVDSSGMKPHAVLLKYSSDGRASQELLQSDALATGDEALEHTTRLVVAPTGEVFLYVEQTRQLFVFDQKGRLRRKLALRFVDELADSKAGRSATVFAFAPSPGGDLFFQAAIMEDTPEPDGTPGACRSTPVLIRVARDGSWSRTGKPKVTGRFVGVDPDGQLLFLSDYPGDRLSLRRIDPVP